MTWDDLKQFFEKFLLTSAVIGAIGGLVELAFKPIRKCRDRKKAQVDAERKRIERENRIDESLANIDQHLEEAVAFEKWKEEVDQKLTEHEEAIQDSKNERRVVWRAQRATLSGLMQLLKRNNEKNESIEKIIEEMDVYVDDNLRQ